MKFVLLGALWFLTLISVAQDVPGKLPDEMDGMPNRKGKGSRIIDDSTKQVYGPTTSKYFFEEEFFLNRKILYTIDTAKWDFHRFNFVHRNQNFYQDLGNMGTSMRPVFDPVQDHIGTSSGFTSGDVYWRSEAPVYYNTKSPYSNMKVILGGKGRSLTRIAFSRNINPRWNMGFNYRVLLVDKQVQRQGKGDRQVRGTYYDLYSAYQTKDSAYSLFINYRRNFQQADEYGGVKTGDTYSVPELFSINAQPNLTEAESNERRSNFHIFHQYRIGSGLQVYHKLDHYKQRNRFNDTEPDDPYYDYTEVDSVQTEDEVEFKTLRNEVGIKGNVFNLFYNGYAAFRDYSMRYRYFNEDHLGLTTADTELYLGGRMEFRLDSLISIKGFAEWMFDERYLIQGSLKTKWFEVAAKRSVSTPSFLSQAYRGSHDIWLNTFNNTEGTEVKGNLIYESKKLLIYPGVRFTTFRNFVFFKDNERETGQRVLPQQSAGYQTWVSPELKLTYFILKDVKFTTQALYTNVLENSEDAIQVPELFVNAQLCYYGIWFRNNFDFQFGVDAHWKSIYYAPGYDLVVQQFYVQKNIIAPEFPILDVFLNVRIKRARVFFKYNNVLKLFTNFANVPTPYYPGLQNLMDFGFDWSFYD